ncbi:MAG: SufD family Fe-S cluster assembly protein [Solobacterium sp.]|nr:SufD family Fe-S cluster assembly protein [Solobacterium sp.]
MRDIRVNEDILLHEGFEEYVIDSIRDLDLSIRFTPNAQALFRIRNAKSLRIRGYAEDGCESTILFWNECQAPLKADETYEVNEGAHIVIAYGECAGTETERSTYVALRKPYAHAEVVSASLVSSPLNYRMNVVHFAPHTLGEIRNFAVVLRTGKLMIDAIGKIVKGAYASKSHQTSRALSFEEGQRSTILPELLIDENDVEASHAMSIGRVDDEQLYYMMSRGLTLQQCTALLSAGYLLPVADVIEDPQVQSLLRAELERKLSEL